MRIRPSSLLVVAAAGAVTLAACSGDDSTGPSGDPAAVEQQAGFALEFLDGLIAGAPDLASGNLTGAFAKAARAPESAVAGPARSHCFDDGACDDLEPSWDASAGAWTASCATAGASCQLSFDFFVQFLDGGGAPQPEPGDTTERVVSRSRIHASFDEPAGAFRMDYDDAMEVSGLHAAEHLVAGSGSMTGSAPNQSVAMTWSYGLTFPAAGGCPSGTVVLTHGAYTITATYSGGSAYTVVIAENGRVVLEKTGTSRCDRTAANNAAIDEADLVFGLLNGLLLRTADMTPRVPSGPLRLDIAPSAWWRADLRECSCPAPHTIPLEWSAGEEAFVGRCTESDLGCDIAEELLVRYLTDTGEPQTAPDERTAHVDVDLRLLFRFIVDLDGPAGARFGIVSHNVRNEIDVDPRQKPYMVTGDGWHEVRLVDASTSEVLANQRSDWTLALGLPLDRDCMTGTIDLAFGPYDAISRYDGTSNLEWEVFRGRETISLRTPDSGCRP